MYILKILEAIFVIGVIIFLCFTMIYAYSVTNKCSIEESTRKFKSIIKIIIKTLFEKEPITVSDIRIGANEDGLMDHDLILLAFADLEKEFKSFFLNKMPYEYTNYIIYSFTAKFPINITIDYIETLTKLIKSITESIVKKYLINIGVDINVSNLVAVYYESESGMLKIAIAKNQSGIPNIGELNISAEKKQKLKELKSLEKKGITEEWEDNN